MTQAAPQDDPGPAHGQRLKADLVLLVVAAIWGSAFVAQRVAAGGMGVYLFNGLRFLLAAVVLWPLAVWQTRASIDSQAHRLPGLGRKTWAGALVAGLLLTIGAALQQAGMQYTTAGNAGFITGLYVVLIPILLAVGWRQRVRPVIWIAALLSVAGMFLLSTGGQLRLNRGDVLILISAFFWALHVIWIGRQVERMDVLHLSVGQYLVCGVVSLALGLALELDGLPLQANDWAAILYTGLFSVGLGYTLQAAAQRTAPPADAAILLSLEAVFAALTGWLILNERLTAVQILGCGIMLAGMLLSQSELLVRRGK